MQIKRFEAKDMTTALRRVKEELGPEAVILSARSIRKGKGFFGSLKYAGVEVSAAVDNQLSGMENARPLTGKDPYRHFNNVHCRHIATKHLATGVRVIECCYIAIFFFHSARKVKHLW